MKLNKITLAIVAAVAAPMMANAGVTVSPLLLGYHWSESISDTADKQRDLLRVGKQLETNGPTNGGITKDDSLYTGAAIGIELTPSTQFQIEYGVTNADGKASEASANTPANRFDVEQEMITGNFLIGTDQVTGYSESALRPYVLIGAGQSKIKVENQESYTLTSPIKGQATGQIPAGTQVAESKDTIGNLGLGAMYRVNDALSLRGEGRAVYNFDYGWWEGMALAGLEVVLGGHLAPAVVVPPVEPVEIPVIEPVVPETPVVVVVPQVDGDSDGDGVLDSADQCPNTPANVVVDATGCPEILKVDDVLQMELRVFFDNDKSVIKDQYNSEIAKVAEKMREYPNSTAQIEGHASQTKRSSAKYNQRLSEARAIAVKSMLTNQFGVEPNRLSTVGYGFTRPIAPNTTPEGQAMNRRVYAVISGNKSTTVERTKDMVVK